MLLSKALVMSSFTTSAGFVESTKPPWARLIGGPPVQTLSVPPPPHAEVSPIVAQMPQLAACERPQLSTALKTPQFFANRAQREGSVSGTQGSPIGPSELSGASTSGCP